ncbi:MAG: tetratricopeptide repeat protein [Bacteroidales bacterium]|nr:tetratricopeptide repeat protein [Bacteroidales bacterium]
MKKSLPKQLFFCIFIVSVLSFPGHMNDVPKLEVNGIVLCNTRPVGNIIIAIYRDSLIADQLLGKRNGRFDVFLDYQHEYVLEFSKEGFVTRKIAISAKVPEKVIMEGGTGFYDLNVEMVEMIKGLNTAIFDQPVKKYIFDEDSYFYIHDKKFENRISEDLAKVDTQIRNLKKQEYQIMIQKGDELLAEKNYEDAWAAFQKAKDYLPGESYPESQMKKLKKLIRQEISNDEGYQNAIAKADKYFNNKEYGPASEYYEKSLIYKPREFYPADQIAKIDSIGSSIYLEKRRSYENEISFAKNHLLSRDYFKAKNRLENALAIMPEDEYARHKLTEVEGLIKEQKEQNAGQKQKDSIEYEYTRLIHDADSFFLAGNYTEARNLFVKAGSQKPDDKYLIRKTKEIDRILNEKSRAEAGSAGPFAEEKIKPEPDTMEAKDIPQKAEVPERKDIIVSVVESDKKITEYIREARDKMELGKEQEAASIYSTIGNIYHNNNQIGKALEFYEKTLEIKKKSDDVEGIPLVLNDIAVALYDTGKYESAVEKYKEAFSLTRETGNKKISAIILNNIAQVYENTFQYENALDYYRQSVEIANELDNKNDAAVLYEKIADVHFERNEFDKAIENFEKTLKIEEELKDDSIVGATLNNMGIAYQSLGNRETALDYYQKSLDITEKQGDKLQTSIALNNIGNVNFD